MRALTFAVAASMLVPAVGVALPSAAQAHDYWRGDGRYDRHDDWRGRERWRERRAWQEARRDEWRRHHRHHNERYYGWRDRSDYGPYGYRW
jgi:hypothetical protein